MCSTVEASGCGPVASRDSAATAGLVAADTFRLTFGNEVPSDLQRSNDTPCSGDGKAGTPKWIAWETGDVYASFRGTSLAWYLRYRFFIQRIPSKSINARSARLRNPYLAVPA